MPRQNRVDPFGELIATDARGALMGNRGVLHDDTGQLTAKRWTHQQWIICQLDFKGRTRSLMSPGCYTELFFYDEAVALAAGHRPCAECRRVEFDRFKAAWIEGNSHLGLDAKASIREIDSILHLQRVSRSREKITYQDRLGNLPNGTFFSPPDQTGLAILVWQNALWRWSLKGYELVQDLALETQVDILTPESTVNALRAGYVPDVNPSE